MRNKNIKDLEKEEKIIDVTTETINYIVTFLTVLALLFSGFALYSIYSISNQGLSTELYHNFKELMKINPDTVAWIELDDTNVNYPVVQAKDNDYYLYKSFEGKDYVGGSIFLDCKNKSDFSDKTNIIHGHHMDTGAMFGGLNKFLKQDYLEKHQSGTLYTPTSEYKLEVIGAGIYDAYESAYYPGADAAKIRESLKKAVSKRDVSISGDDQIVVLSTCAGDMTNNRTAVFCKMVYTGEYS